MGDVFSGIVQGVGMIFDYLGSEAEKDAAEDYADAQAAELERVARANAEISYIDAKTAVRLGQQQNFEANAKAGLKYNVLQRLLSTQRTSYGKSGVSLQEGSPVDVMEETTKAAAQDIMNIKYGGKTAQAKANSLARRYVKLAEHGLRDAAAQAALIQGAANDTVDAITWNQWSNIADNLYEWNK